MQLPELQRGRALIITGPQGCGKSTLARELAMRHTGHAHEMDASELDTRNGIKAALEPMAGVLIVDGLPSTQSGLENVKTLLTSERLSMRPHYSVDLVDVVPPLLIFTTNDIEQARAVAADDRRLDLLDLSIEPASA